MSCANSNLYNWIKEETVLLTKNTSLFYRMTIYQVHVFLYSLYVLEGIKLCSVELNSNNQFCDSRLPLQVNVTISGVDFEG